MSVDLSVDLGKFQLKNPVITASGTFGYGEEYHRFYDISRLGAVTVKGIRMTPSHGNPMPRVAEVTGGMLNAIGLQGPGVEKFLHDEHYPQFLPCQCPPSRRTFCNHAEKSLPFFARQCNGKM